MASARLNRTGFFLSKMFRSLRHRNYRLFFYGQSISLMGTWTQNIAESWLVYRLTHSAFLLGVTAFVSQLPLFLVSPVGGVMADRHNRHSILIGTQILSMILSGILAILTLSDAIQVWQILVLAGLLGTVNAIDLPVRQSFVVEMVGKKDLSNAIALNSSMFNGARLMGPAIAGVLLAWVGEGWCFLLNSLSYITVITGLLMMKLPAWQKAVQVHSAWEHVLEGFQYAFKNGPVRSLLYLLGFTSLMGVPFTTLMPIFADQIFKGGPKDLGFLMGAAGLGAFLGAFSLTFRDGTQGLGNWIALGAFNFGVFLILFSHSQNIWLSAILLVFVGYFMMIQIASTNTLLQALVPDRLRGRVMAFYSMMFFGMTPFGSLLSGSVEKPLGAPATVALGGIACSVAALIFFINLPKLKTQAKLILNTPAEDLTSTSVQ